MLREQKPKAKFGASEPINHFISIHKKTPEKEFFYE
jgi:hypothetical protein